MIENLEQLLQEELKDIYDAEKQLVKALPKMAKAAGSEELREALTEHLEVTKGQVKRLEDVFEALDAKAKGKPCAGMKGLIEEGQEIMQEEMSEELLDAALIGAAQRVEHYEIAAYGTARTFAERLGHSDVVDLLQETLDEEKQADEKLTEISESLLGGMAGSDSDSEEEDETEQMESPTPSPRKGAASGKRANSGGGR